jgi:hypothetical protein
VQPHIFSSGGQVSKGNIFTFCYVTINYNFIGKRGSWEERKFGDLAVCVADPTFQIVMVWIRILAHVNFVQAFQHEIFALKVAFITFLWTGSSHSTCIFLRIRNTF